MSALEFDIIFAGGGTSGSVAAGRLAAADPSLRILLVEQGPHTFNEPLHTRPSAYLAHLAPTSTTATFHVAQPSESLGGRSIIVPTGRCVGGGSAINFMMATRASRSDYDDWEKVHGNPGWGSKDLCPLLRKTETNHIWTGAVSHGYDGPLHVSGGGHSSALGTDFLETAGSYDKDRVSVGNANDTDAVNIYNPWPKWIDPVTGRRQDAAHGFVYNQKSNKNLVVNAECKVNRVIFDGNRATGVEYKDVDGKVFTAHAKKLVVVSAGAFGSPNILERSGVGARSLLEKFNIPIVSDLPGVGENYQDHNLLLPSYLSDKGTDTFDEIFRFDPSTIEKHAGAFEKGQGMLASNGIDGGVKPRPVNKKDFEELGEEFTARWKSYFEKDADKPLLWLGCASAFLGPGEVAPMDVYRYFSIAFFSLYPISTGSVHITGTSTEDPHHFLSGFLDDPADVSTLRWGYKRSRELARRMPSYRGEHTIAHPTFPEGSEAAAGEKPGPAAISAPDIHYTAEDDVALEIWIRGSAQTTWHSMSTCSMTSKEKMGVLDSRLNVYGTKGLKVADLSVCPSNVGSNTYSTALVVGERAAEIIAEDLGIQGV